MYEETHHSLYNALHKLCICFSFFLDFHSFIVLFFSTNPLIILSLFNKSVTCNYDGQSMNNTNISLYYLFLLYDIIIFYEYIWRLGNLFVMWK